MPRGLPGIRQTGREQLMGAAPLGLVEDVCGGFRDEPVAGAELARDEQRHARGDQLLAAGADELAAQRPSGDGDQCERLPSRRREPTNPRREREPQAAARLTVGNELLDEQRIAAGQPCNLLDGRGRQVGPQVPRRACASSAPSGSTAMT